MIIGCLKQIQIYIKHLVRLMEQKYIEMLHNNLRNMLTNINH